MIEHVRINEYYTIYSNGKLYSHITNKFVTEDKSNRCGYIRVTMYKPKRKRWLLHRLVAEYFVEKVEGKPFVNHIDGNKENNDASNLEWCSQSENEKHAYSNGLRPNAARPCMYKGKRFNLVVDLVKYLYPNYSKTEYNEVYNHLLSESYPDMYLLER